MDVPHGPDGQAVLPPEIWEATPPAAQALIGALVPLLALVPQVEALQARLREVERRLGQNSSNSSRLPSSHPPRGSQRDSAGPREARAGGGHAGSRGMWPTSEGWPRRSGPATCRACAAVLEGRTPVAEPVVHQVTDLPPLRATVTEDRLQRLACAACGQTTGAVLPADVPAGAFGPRLQAVVALLSGRYRLSRREVADVCGTLLDVPVCVGSVDGLCQATAAALAAPVAATQATLPAAPVVNADEGATSFPGD